MNVYTMPGVTDLVWMGASQMTPDMGVGLIHSDSSEMMLDHDSPFFSASHHSTSNHSLEDINVHHSPMQEMDALGMLEYEDMKQDSNDDTDPFIDSGTEDGSGMPASGNGNGGGVLQPPPMRYMMSTATQTPNLTSRKIKPIKHPGLVLKTPIAYQSDTDPAVIPIQKDGMAVCEKCGAIGVKHAFYTRERRFCSMACARGYSGLTPEPLNPATTTPTPPTSNTALNSHYSEYKFKLEMEDDFSNTISDEPLPQLPPAPPIPLEPAPPRRKPAELANTHDWDSQLNDSQFFAAPVSCFRHAPIAEIWDNILVGMKVEVENTDCDDFSDNFHDSFWVATVLKITGYKALMRYEGFGSNCSKDFWVSLCSAQVHPVGWCATRGKPLIPPKTIEDKYNDWKEFLVKRLTGARTLPSNFSTKVADSLKSRFQCGLNLEVVDKNRISQVKVAMIHKIIGKRLHVRYYDSPPEDNGFWCHEDSPLIHPVGWAKKVGHTLHAPLDYLERINEAIWDEDDATEDLFLPSQTGTNESSFFNTVKISNRGMNAFSSITWSDSPFFSSSTSFCEGMKLEAIDPLNLSSICVATVMDVLRCGYIMIRIDSYDVDETGADWFCYHVTSPCIFPAGFCDSNNIPLTPPKGCENSPFSWEAYLAKTHQVAAGVHLFNREMPSHGFVVGMKMEAADLMDPRLVCVATVAKVVGRLLKVHFDGWEDEYDQWLDCESPDIYPVGWCQLVGHKLEGPRVTNSKTVAPVVKSPKGLKKRGRKKKKDTTPPKSTLFKTEKVVKIIKEDCLDVDVVKQEMDIEPEAGQEPVGPDQSMPVAAEPTPPPERKATSYINSTGTSAKVIPRLVDSTGGSCDPGELCPSEWNVFDVAQFLRVNDCANYCDTFSKQKIDGKTLLTLTKDEIINFTGMKVGPSLKIFDLIQQLKIKVNPAQSRLMKANIKKFL